MRLSVVTVQKSMLFTPYRPTGDGRNGRLKS
jgi:hypothetical protein